MSGPIDVLGSIRLHLGAPREPVFATIEPAADTVIDGHRYPASLSIRPKRQITWMYGISWRTKRGFVFVGAQFHKKQKGES